MYLCSVNGWRNYLQIYHQSIIFRFGGIFTSLLLVFCLWLWCYARQIRDITRRSIIGQELCSTVASLAMVLCLHSTGYISVVAFIQNLCRSVMDHGWLFQCYRVQSVFFGCYNKYNICTWIILSISFRCLPLMLL